MPKSVKKAKGSTRTKVVAVAATPFPSYWAFTKYVYDQLKQSKYIFLRLIGLMTLLVIILTLTTQQATYVDQAVGIQSVSSEVSAGILSKLLETGVLFVTLISGTLTAYLSESQQFIFSMIYLMVWLTVVWLLRNIISGKEVSMRDGVYSAGAPVISILIITFIAAVQLIPLAILAALLSAITSTGAISGILIALGVVLVLAVAVMTLYWLIGTLFGAVIVTIPGTYPFAALRSAREVVAGKRALLLRRLLWLGLVNFFAYSIVIIPILFLDSLAGYALSWVTVAISIVLSLCLFIFSSAYLYLLYRRIIDERA